MSDQTVDDKLGLDKFYIDERVAHIAIDKDCPDVATIKLLVAACPAALYHYENNTFTFSYEGCLECGTCRVLAGGIAITRWDYPADGFGVDYRQG